MKKLTFLALVFLLSCQSGTNPARSARTQPGTMMGLYAPEQHELYDGRFNIVGRNIYQAGSLDDVSPWDHMDDDASDLQYVGGEIEIDVNEIDNSGSFIAELVLPQGLYRVELERFTNFPHARMAVLQLTCLNTAMPGAATATGPRVCSMWLAGVMDQRH